MQSKLGLLPCHWWICFWSRSFRCGSKRKKKDNPESLHRNLCHIPELCLQMATTLRSTHLKRQPQNGAHIFARVEPGLTNSAFARQQCWMRCQAVIGNFCGSSLICLSSLLSSQKSEGENERERGEKVWTGDESSGKKEEEDACGGIGCLPEKVDFSVLQRFRLQIQPGNAKSYVAKKGHVWNISSFNYKQ